MENIGRTGSSGPRADPRAGSSSRPWPPRTAINAFVGELEGVDMSAKTVRGWLLEVGLGPTGTSDGTARRKLLQILRGILTELSARTFCTFPRELSSQAATAATGERCRSQTRFCSSIRATCGHRLSVRPQAHGPVKSPWSERRPGSPGELARWRADKGCQIPTAA